MFGSKKYKTLAPELLKIQQGLEEYVQTELKSIYDKNSEDLRNVKEGVTKDVLTRRDDILLEIRNRVTASDKEYEVKKEKFKSYFNFISWRPSFSKKDKK